MPKNTVARVLLMVGTGVLTLGTLRPRVAATASEWSPPTDVQAADNLSHGEALLHLPVGGAGAS